jgi:hypothetical protein
MTALDDFVTFGNMFTRFRPVLESGPGVIAAIKALREMEGSSLKEAKNAYDDAGLRGLQQTIHAVAGLEQQVEGLKDRNNSLVHRLNDMDAKVRDLERHLDDEIGVNRDLEAVIAEHQKAAEMAQAARLLLAHGHHEAAIKLLDS